MGVGMRQVARPVEESQGKTGLLCPGNELVDEMTEERLLPSPTGLRRGSLAWQVAMWMVNVLEEASLYLADFVISEVENPAHERPRQARFPEKRLPWAARFVDLDLFRPQTRIPGRGLTIGYVGRLAEEKGILELLEALPSILVQKPEAGVLIVGDGPLGGVVRARVAAMEARDRITVTGFQPRHLLPAYLNQLRLLVLPSREEGLPTILLEAIACGTPVLARPVGAVPEVIAHLRTGFLLHDWSPKGITLAVLSALHHPRLSAISREARMLAERKYSYDAAVKRYHKMLGIILGWQSRGET